MSRYRTLALLPLLLAACGPVDGKDTAGTDDTASGGDDTYTAGNVAWEKTMSDFAEVSAAVGTVVTGTCPAATPADFGSVWGTTVYTDDSSVCTAALHDGRITLEGGAFTAEILAGQEAYLGSTANGVTSEDWDAWPRSFTFLP